MSDLDKILLDDPIEDEPEQEEIEDPKAEEPAEPEPAKQAEPEPEPELEPVAAKQEVPQVPLTALHQVRDENRELKDRLAELEKAQNAPPPDFLDPDGAKFFQQQMAQMQANMAAEISEAKARARYGDQVISQAFEAAQQSGVLDQFRGGQDPWGRLGAWHKQNLERAKLEEISTEIGGDLASYKERLRQELLAEIQANQVAENVKSVPKAPSLASDPNLGSRTAPEWSGPTPLNDILGG